MPLCRWSSDNHRCDLSIYESDRFVYEIYVAGRRFMFPVLPESWRLSTWLYKWCEVGYDEEKLCSVYPVRWKGWLFLAYCVPVNWYGRLRAWLLEHNPPREWKSPIAGKHYEETSPEDCLERVLELRSLGARFPDNVLEALHEDMVEYKKTNGC